MGTGKQKWGQSPAGTVPSRRSKFIVAIARWALMAGLAGIVISALAGIDALRAPDNTEGRRTLLVLAAILLSLTFVLAPFVRRAFMPPDRPKQSTRATRKTLLDEIRERGDADLDRDTAPVPPEPLPNGTPQRSLASKLLMGAYLVFAIALGCVLLAMSR